LQAHLDRLIGKHGLGVGRIVVDGADVKIEISGALEPEEVAILQRWLEAETSRMGMGWLVSCKRDHAQFTQSN